jgi:hypothetical protein
MASADRTAYPRFSHPLSDKELAARYGANDEETALTLEKSLGAGARLFPVAGRSPETDCRLPARRPRLPAFTALLDARVKTKTLFR